MLNLHSLILLQYKLSQINLNFIYEKHNILAILNSLNLQLFLLCLNETSTLLSVSLIQ